MKKENTGKYQVYRTTRGIANTKKVIYTAESKDKLKEYLKDFKKEEGFDYYCQEEVIY